MNQAVADYRLVRSKRRSFELRVYPGGEVELRAPQRARQHDIDAFYESRQQWLARKIDELAARPPASVWQCEQAARLFFLGEPLQLQLRVGPPNVAGEGSQLCLSLPASKADCYQPLLENWFRHQAKACFSTVIDHHFPYFAQLGHVRPQLRVKKMRTRWGSLSSRGYINLNIALMQYPPELVEYVVVHELCHLQHMNHGKEFKALQSERLPDWQQRKQQLETLAHSQVSIFDRGR